MVSGSAGAGPAIDWRSTPDTVKTIGGADAVVVLGAATGCLWPPPPEEQPAAVAATAIARAVTARMAGVMSLGRTCSRAWHGVARLGAWWARRGPSPPSRALGWAWGRARRVALHSGHGDHAEDPDRRPLSA